MFRYDTAGVLIIADAIKFTIKNHSIFIWCLVMVHRRISLGDEISNITSWLEQYCEHIQKCGTPYDGSKHKFRYIAERPYSGMRLDYATLTAWVMNPKFGDGLTIKYARRWDTAIQALIDYDLDRTDQKWVNFTIKMKEARKPFW